MTLVTNQAAFTFAEWAVIWSPGVEKDRRSEAWRLLELPGDYDNLEPEYWSVFHVGSPQPKLSLLLHSALNMEGGHVREEWMRVFHFLGLSWKESTLPPDHLAPACDALALALANGDDILVSELGDRYLLPWCERGSELLKQSPMLAVTEQFKSDLLQVVQSVGDHSQGASLP